MEILVKFCDRDNYFLYTKNILEMLMADPEVEIILDKQTGEILYESSIGNY